jgi:TolB protein
VNIAPSHIWTVELATGRPVRVTEHLSLNVSPQWLPDGRGLLFVSNRNGPRDVYLVWLDGSGARRSDPVRVTTGLNPHSISIADDGSKLVYSQLVFRTNIWELPIPETGSVSLSVAKQVTVGNQTIENHGLSSDGRWLAYDSNRDGNQEIYVMPLAGGEPRQLTTDPGDDFHPDFSPDGRELVFYSMRHGTRDLFLVSADGGNEIRLTDSPNQEYHPTFSPDGLSIAYQEIDAAGRGYIMLMTRDAIGGEWSAPRQLAEVGDGLSEGVRWSPDGRRMISSRRQHSIVATTLDGQERVVMDGPTLGFTGVSWPEWSSDGNDVYFMGANREGTEGLWAIAVTGGSPRLMVRFDDPTRDGMAWGISVTPHKVYLSLPQHESDIWVMDLEY